MADLKPENVIRVQTLAELLDFGPDDAFAEECLVELLADVRFACDALHLDFAALDRRAYAQYTEAK